MLNVLALSMRVEGLGPSLAAEAFSIAESLVSDLEFQPSHEETLALCQRSGISAYDAEFVLAAERLGAPLLTRDTGLLKAFPALTLSLPEFGAP